MADIPQFDDTQPILPTTELPVSASGLDAIGEEYGRAADMSAQAAMQIGSEMSQAMLFNQSNSLDQAKTKAQLEIAANPDPTNINQVTNGFSEQADSLINNAPLNRADRAQLTRYSVSANNSLNTFAATQQLTQAKRTAAIQFNDTYPQQLQSASQNLFQNPTIGYAQLQNLHETAATAVKTGVLSIDGYRNLVGAMNAVQDRHSQLQGLIQQSGVPTAAQYHYYTAFNPSQPNQENEVPLQSTAQFHYDSLTQNATYQQALNALQNGSLLGSAWPSMTQSQFKNYLQAAQGVATAKGVINSAQPYRAIQQREALLSTNNGMLSPAQKAERQQYLNFMRGLKVDYPSTIQQTPKGQQIADQFNSQVAAINNAPLSPGARAQAYNQAVNTHLTQMVSLGNAMGIPQNLIKPLSPQITAPAQNAFAAGANPADAIKVINNYDPSNRVWVAASMQTPRQQEVLHIASLLQGTNQSVIAPMLISANQTGQDYSALKVMNRDNQAVSPDSAITSALMTNDNIKQVYNHLSTMANAPQRLAALQSSLINGVKYMAIKNHDITCEHLTNYATNLGKALTTAYPLQKGSTYSINPNEMGMNLTPQEMRAVSGYLIHQVTNTARGQLRGGVADGLLDTNPLSVVSTPTGALTVKDSTGQAYTTTPITEDLVGASQHWWHQRYPLSQNTLKAKLQGNPRDFD